jgi:hypothetical protein
MTGNLRTHCTRSVDRANFLPHLLKKHGLKVLRDQRVEIKLASVSCNAPEYEAVVDAQKWIGRPIGSLGQFKELRRSFILVCTIPPGRDERLGLLDDNVGFEPEIIIECTGVGSVIGESKAAAPADRAFLGSKLFA